MLTPDTAQKRQPHIHHLRLFKPSLTIAVVGAALAVCGLVSAHGCDFEDTDACQIFGFGPLWSALLVEILATGIVFAGIVTFVIGAALFVVAGVLSTVRMLLAGGLD